MHECTYVRYLRLFVSPTPLCANSRGNHSALTLTANNNLAAPHTIIRSTRCCCPYSCQPLVGEKQQNNRTTERASQLSAFLYQVTMVMREHVCVCVGIVNSTIVNALPDLLIQLSCLATHHSCGAPAVF